MIIFAGFDITSYSVKPCKKYLDKIPHFPATNNITNMYSWFKLINKVLYSFAANKSILPFREAVDRKSTRLNSSHANISYAVFCLKKKKNTTKKKKN